jgi:ABC-type amino acid transport substrate-binding protein
VALIGVSGREVLLENLNVLSKALARITSFVVRLTPVGVFAIAASAAGTLTIEDFGRLQVYVFTYAAGALLVSFWVLPGLVAALTPVRYRDVMRASRDALVTAFSTGSTFVVLPLLADCAKRLLEGVDDSEEAEAVVDVIVPVTFNFPNAGRLFALAFVVFAAWFAGSAIPVSQYPALAITGLFSLFGSVNVAVPFLLDLFRVPADMFQLFLAVGILDSRFATLLAAMHILALAVMGTCAVRGQLVVQWAKLARYVLLGGVRWYLTSVLQGDYRKYTLVTGRSLSEEPVSAVVHTELPGDMTPRVASGSRLDRIRASGVIRVGYANGSLPFAYFNDAGALVGFDVEMAHRLAKDLGVSLEFVPFDFWKLSEHLEADHFDVAMTGVAIAADRSQEMAFTTPTMDVTFAFFVKDHRREQFSTRESVQRLDGLRIGAPLNPYYRAKVREYLPDAELVSIDSLDQYVEEYGDELDAAVGAAESLAAWTLLHPQYSVAVPQPDPFRAPLAYPVARGDQELVNFLNDWIELKRKDNTIDALYRYWILGRDEVRREARWSVIRDVLHWVD